MARMKTGRLTSRTTPPPNESSNQAAWNKYESDVKAYNNYDSDVRSYNEKMKKYNEEMKGQSGGYNYSKFAGGKSGTRRLSSSELAEFNKSQPLESEWVDIPKSYKGKLSEVNAFMSKPKKPVAPVRGSVPVVPELPMNKLPILNPTRVATNRKISNTKKEKSSQGWFGDIVPNTKNASNKQLKQFVSYASKSGLNENFIGKTKSEIGQYKDEMKSQRKSYLKEGNLEGIKATTAEIRQARNAGKFTGSKNPLDVPGMAIGYQREQDHAANRNTIKSQLDRLKKLR